MATEAHRHVMPVLEPVGGDEPPDATPLQNLYAPISTENRITGQPRVRRQRVQAQLTPGSNYDYGRPAYGNGEDRPESLLSEEETLGYQKSVPPTFLRRTLLTDHRPLPPPAWGGGLTGLTAGGGYSAAQTTATPDAGRTVPQGRAGGATPGGMWTSEPAVAQRQVISEGNPPQPGYRTVSGDAAEPFWMNAPTSVWHAVSAAQGYAPEAAATVEPPARTTPRAGERRRRGAPGSAAGGEPVQPAGGAASVAAQAEGGGMPYPVAESNPLPPGYLPRHARAARANAQSVPSMTRAPETVIDPWEAMGWKMHEPSPFENTSVMRLADLTMFERSAFEEPPNPYDYPPGADRPYGTPTGDLYCMHPMEPGATGGTALPEHPAAGQPYDEYAAAAFVPDAYPYPRAAENPANRHGREEQAYSVGEGYGGDGSAYAETSPYPDAVSPAGEPGTAPRRNASEHGGVPPRSAPSRRDISPRRAPTPAPSRKKRPRTGFSLAALGPVRTALLIGVSLALLFVLMEGFKIAQNLFSGEEQMKQYQNEYFRLTGQEPAASASGVELLPAGQTYTPTATPVPVTTATPTPRVDQNDPLIGVLGGDGAQTTFQAALPTATAATRTRLNQYPDNPLLSISEDFAALRAQNPDVVGRLTIEGVMDETVVQRNNTFYLTHNARGLFGDGAVFVDEGVVLKKPPENLLLRGETTPEGKLFSALTRYGTDGATFIQQHGIITCDTIYEKARYVVFAVVHADSRTDSENYFNYAGYPVFQSDAQMQRYVEAACKRSAYPINVNVQPGDRLLTLATISEGSDTACWVILCRMLRNGETPENIQHN